MVKHSSEAEFDLSLNGKVCSENLTLKAVKPDNKLAIPTPAIGHMLFNSFTWFHGASSSLSI